MFFESRKENFEYFCQKAASYGVCDETSGDDDHKRIRMGKGANSRKARYLGCLRQNYMLVYYDSGDELNNSILNKSEVNVPTDKMGYSYYAEITPDDYDAFLDYVRLHLGREKPSSAKGINFPLNPKKIIREPDGSIMYQCPLCDSLFKRARRCPECGQLTKEDSDNSNSTKLLRIGDDLSGLRIFEIINRYFGENYKGWMKATYVINDDYTAWFPVITDSNTRPDGNFGGTAMWSNTLTPDRKTVISMNHDETIDDLPEEEIYSFPRKKKVLIFGRIKGSFEFLGVFDDKLVLENKVQTWRHDRIASGIDLSTYELIE